jgi:hypothetical protein
LHRHFIFGSFFSWHFGNISMKTCSVFLVWFDLVFEVVIVAVVVVFVIVIVVEVEFVFL